MHAEIYALQDKILAGLGPFGPARADALRDNMHYDLMHYEDFNCRLN
jgi:hypothetical protein